MQIRTATISDLQEITEIFNETILNSIASFNTEEKSLEEQEQWFFRLTESGFPVVVAEENGKVIGWGSLAPWADRCAYSKTAEISTYVHKDHRGLGIGCELKLKIVEIAKAKGLHTVISRMAGSNPANEKLNKKLGFEHIGTMKEVGFKFGQYHDVHLYQKIL